MLKSVKNNFIFENVVPYVTTNNEVILYYISPKLVYDYGVKGEINFTNFMRWLCTMRDVKKIIITDGESAFKHKVLLEENLEKFDVSEQGDMVFWNTEKDLVDLVNVLKSNSKCNLNIEIHTRNEES